MTATNMRFLARRGAAKVVIFALLWLAACGSQSSEVELPKAAAEQIKELGKRYLSKLSGSGEPPSSQGPVKPADPNMIVKKALAATKGPIALAVRVDTNAVLAINPVGRNGDYVTWGSAPGQGLTFKRGVLANTRGLGDDLMAARIDTAVSAITGRREAIYQREHFYLGDLGQNTSLKVECKLTRVKTERIEFGEINADAVVMKEDCQRGEIKFTNVYWVDGRERILKSSQWIGQRLGSLAVQNLRL